MHLTATVFSLIYNTQCPIEALYLLKPLSKRSRGCETIWCCREHAGLNCINNKDAHDAQKRLTAVCLPKGYKDTYTCTFAVCDILTSSSTITEALLLSYLHILYVLICRGLLGYNSLFFILYFHLLVSRAFVITIIFCCLLTRPLGSRMQLDDLLYLAYVQLLFNGNK